MDVEDLSARTLVIVVDTFRVVMENNARVVKDNNELLKREYDANSKDDRYDDTVAAKYGGPGEGRRET